MPFNITERKSYKSFDRPTYLTLTPGLHRVRFLEPTEEARVDEKHFLVTPTGRMTVKCLGDECPICANNRSIYQAHPDDYRDQPGYFSRSDAYTINVLDRTEVKTCPNDECQAEVKGTPKFPHACPSCGTMLPQETHPSNKVKLLQTSRTLAQQISQIEVTKVDGNQVPIPLTKYDMMFSVNDKKGKSKVVVPISDTDHNDVVEVPEDALLNKDCILTLSADEIADVLKGISLRDIFKARNTKASSDFLGDDSDDTSTEDALAEDAKKAMDNVKKNIAEMYGE